MDGRNGQAGVMFDVVAKKDIHIVGIGSIHTTSRGGVDVEVWTKKGTYDGFQRDADAWTLVASTSVPGKGRNKPTPLPHGIMDEIDLDQGETQAFYVTLLNTVMRYSNGDKDSQAVDVSNSDLEILEGVGKGYPFKSTYNARVFNGSILYEVR